MKFIILIWRWCPAVLCMALIFYFSHQPSSRLESYLPWFQKMIPWMDNFDWGHLVAYFVLGITVYFGVGPRWAHRKGRITTVIICTVYGVLDEYHQTFIDGRTAELTDILNDALGATFAVLIMSIPRVHQAYMRVARKY